MFGYKSSPKGPSLVPLVITNYLTSSVNSVYLQQISYDNPVGFQATLTVHTLPTRFLSFSFMYQPKNNKGTILSLSLTNMGDGKVSVFANSTKNCSYVLANCEEKLLMLVQNIIKVNDVYNMVQQNLNQCPGFMRGHLPKLFEQYAKLTRSLVNADQHSDYVLKELNKIFEQERLSFESIITSSSKEEDVDAIIDFMTQFSL